MNDTNQHDHSHITHRAVCDVAGCPYVAQVHAHDDETAAMVLSEDLARHNKEEHGKETKAEAIIEEVKAKMQTGSS